LSDGSLLLADNKSDHTQKLDLTKSVFDKETNRKANEIENKESEPKSLSSCCVDPVLIVKKPLGSQCVPAS